MDKAETLQEYYRRTCRALPDDLKDSDGMRAHFNVLKRNNCYASLHFTRRDYYKICLTQGQALLRTDKGTIKIERPAIFFSNTNIRFGWENLSPEQKGYVCLFNEQFMGNELRKALDNLFKLFRNDTYSFLFLQAEQYEQFTQYFEWMLSEYHSDFVYKKQVIEDFLRLIAYHAIKLRMADGKILEKPDGDLVNRFYALLERQFPIESPDNPLKLKTPADYAHQLQVHVNHLNYSLRSYFGKTTSTLIQDRTLQEALDLLQYSQWRIAEIAYGLGFEYPQHFNNFFKKKTGKSPRDYRDLLTINI
ncbi:response regulator transcription factor [Olivibacter ginsenosidimutans]|uniref:Response regulator transcription factor n=1 Tax=Olivibacter ginsenosidimutans TaxID=1176537 RepID=A0ABP9CE81_9SPHI